MSYDNKNIFAKILRGEIPCKKIYLIENFLDQQSECYSHLKIDLNLSNLPKGLFLDNFSRLFYSLNHFTNSFTSE